MKQHTRHIWIIALLLMMACVKPYDFDAQSYEKVLVIDGAISNLDGPYTVQISYTYPLETNRLEYVNDADVWVEDSDGNTFLYNPVEDNKYESPANLKGEVGEEYTLYVELRNGAQYKSNPQQLLSSPPIDTIYGKYAELPNNNETANTGGIQFFIDSDNSSGKAKHFRYEWEEGYKIVTPYPASHKLLEDSSIVPLDTAIGICYKEGASNSLMYASSIGSTSNKILEFPIRYIPEGQQQLRTRYSILVKQYAIGESAYLFYKRLNENNESGGSLFDQQTGSVYGNMTSVTNPDEAVLGFFEVAGISQKRSFFNYQDLDERYDYPQYPYFCLASEAIITVPDSAAFYLEAEGGNIYEYVATPPFSVSIHSMACTDCSFYADVIPPDYWTE